MKKLKAFTLIELIVAMTIFAILMAGIVRMIAPMNDAAVTSRVVNNQQTVESAVVNFIGENVRYASNLLVIEEGAVLKNAAGTNITVSNAETAIDAFLAYGPVNTKGTIDTSVAANRQAVKVICFDGATSYSYVNKNYTGRVISSLDDRTANLDMTNVKQDGSAPQYMVFGDAYYGPGDYYLSVKMNSADKVLYLECTSDYYLTNAKNANKKQSSWKTSGSAHTATAGSRGSFEMRNYGVGSYTFDCISKSGAAEGDPIYISPSNKNKVYFVFYDECEDLAFKTNAAVAKPTIVTGKSAVTAVSNTVKTAAQTSAATTAPQTNGGEDNGDNGNDEQNSDS